MMKKIFWVICALLLVCGCASVRNGVSQGSPSLQYLSTQGDGSVVVRVSNSGRNYADALSNARRYAIREVMFKGIPGSGNSILSKPLVTEVNAEEKYQTFFNSFFADDGAYKQFASSKDRRSGSNQLTKNTVSVRVVTTVTVLRADLKEFLIDNRIIKP